MPAETPLERLRTLVEKLERERDRRVIAGRARLKPGDTIEDVWARVHGRPPLTLIQGGRDDA